jgi:hypothetical protein
MDLIQLFIISFLWIVLMWAIAIFISQERAVSQKIETQSSNIKNLSQNRLVFNKKTGYYEKIIDLDEDDIEVLN